MRDGWIERARRALIASADGPSWAYRRGGTPAVEPTALAALGLLATAAGPGGPTRGLAARAGDRLASLQRPDGSLGVHAGLPSPGWATPYAALLWRALGTHDRPRRRAVDWLLGERVDAPARLEGSIAGHDTAIPGWPWVEGTHSWIEPTALALLALGGEDLRDHPRSRQGVRLLRDRAIGSGGWNYGNSVVFGRRLRPQPAPTGMALLALARHGDGGAIVDRAAAYLRGALPEVRAAGSLGWGILGLRAWGEAPASAGEWLGESADSVLSRDDAAPRLGLLLLAASEPAPELLGLNPTRSHTA